MLQYKIRNKLKKKKQLRKSIRSREHIKEKRKTERLRRGPIKICQESIKKKKIKQMCTAVRRRPGGEGKQKGPNCWGGKTQKTWLVAWQRA